jgi:hypothetical protein
LHQVVLVRLWLRYPWVRIDVNAQGIVDQTGYGLSAAAPSGGRKLLRRQITRDWSPRARG